MIIEFKKEKYSGFDGRTYVSFTQKDSTAEKPFKMTASPSGISFSGTLQGELESHTPDMQDFARMVSEVWKEHLKLRPIIMRSSTQQ